MKLIHWLRPGIGVKRWFLLGVLGLSGISLGLMMIVRNLGPGLIDEVLSLMLILSGSMLIYLSGRNLTGTLLYVLFYKKFNISLDSHRLDNMLNERRIYINGPKIVVIGGGTGLSTMLRGLKEYSSNLTAIVTVSDDGGGSGILRQDLGILPPGDIRNCITALADTEPVMQQLLQYRFQEGMLKGQSFGNLFLAAMDGISSSFEEAVKNMSQVLAVTGRVLPVTLQDIRLCAELEDGYVICGESKIGKHHEFHKGKIHKVFLEPERVEPLKDVLEAIDEADVIVLGPGSLYTSVIPNLLVDGVAQRIKQAGAPKVYVCNVMTQPGETEGYSAYEHIRAIESHTSEGLVDFCIVNTAGIPEELREKYLADGADTVKVDMDALQNHGVKVVTGDFTSVSDKYIRHNSKKLAAVIAELVAKEVLAKDKKRIIDYYYVKDRLRKFAV